MSKVLVSIIAISAFLFSSCNSDKKMIDLEWKIYHSAMEHGDYSTGINSLNRIVAVEKYNADALDTLALLYLSAGSNDAASKLATRALNIRESDALVRVLGKAYKGLGKHDLSLEYFSKLLAKKPQDLEMLYEVSYAKINVGKLREALPEIQMIIAHPESEKKLMQEFINEGSQMVPYKAVALNMLGFLQNQAGQPADAMVSYQSALAIFPKYYLAGNNLKILTAKNQAK